MIDAPVTINETADGSSLVFTAAINYCGNTGRWSSWNPVVHFKDTQGEIVRTVILDLSFDTASDARDFAVALDASISAAA